MRIVILIAAFMYMFQAQAGLISTIMKAGKKADGDLSEIRHLDVDLPKGIEGSPLAVSQDHNGHWLVRAADGQNIPVHDLAAIKQAAGSSPLLVMDNFDLPKDLGELNAFPDTLPLYIKNNKQLYKIERGESLYIAKGPVRVKVGSSAELQSAIWHLNRRFSPDKVYRVGMSKSIGSDSAGVSLDAGLSQLLHRPERFRLKTVAVAGELKEDSIQVAGQWVPVKKLTALAADQDINLVILPVKNKATANKLGRKLAQRDKGAENSTQDFLENFIRPGEVMDLKINPSGRSQIVIAQSSVTKSSVTKPSEIKKSATKEAADLTELPINLLLNGIKIFRPDQKRAEEMDRRWHPLLPSWIQFYLLISFILASVQPRFTWWALSHLWRAPIRENYSHWFNFYFVRWIRAVVFIAALFPLLGAVCFGLNLVMVIYRVIKRVVVFFWAIVNFLFVRPFLFIRGLVVK